MTVGIPEASCRCSERWTVKWGESLRSRKEQTDKSERKRHMWAEESWKVKWHSPLHKLREFPVRIPAVTPAALTEVAAVFCGFSWQMSAILRLKELCGWWETGEGGGGGGAARDEAGWSSWRGRALSLCLSVCLGNSASCPGLRLTECKADHLVTSYRMRVAASNLILYCGSTQTAAPLFLFLHFTRQFHLFAECAVFY